jgi:phospholipid/cholesterol/gamma-HCH transport system ATP-binding protein
VRVAFRKRTRAQEIEDEARGRNGDDAEDRDEMDDRDDADDRDDVEDRDDTDEAATADAEAVEDGDPLTSQGYGGEEDFANRDYIIPGVDSEDPEPYKWHTGKKRDHGGEDAIEIIDLVKQFGRTRILNGCNLGLPDNMISMVLGPSGTGKSVLIKHIVGLL